MINNQIFALFNLNLITKFLAERKNIRNSLQKKSKKLSWFENMPLFELLATSIFL